MKDNQNFKNRDKFSSYDLDTYKTSHKKKKPRDKSKSKKKRAYYDDY